MPPKVDVEKCTGCGTCVDARVKFLRLKMIRPKVSFRRTAQIVNPV